MSVNNIPRDVNRSVDVNPMSPCESAECECAVRRYTLDGLAKMRKHAQAVNDLMNTIC